MSNALEQLVDAVEEMIRADGSFGLSGRTIAMKVLKEKLEAYKVSPPILVNEFKPTHYNTKDCFDCEYIGEPDVIHAPLDLVLYKDSDGDYGICTKATWNREFVSLTVKPKRLTRTTHQYYDGIKFDGTTTSMKQIETWMKADGWTVIERSILNGIDFTSNGETIRELDLFSSDDKRYIVRLDDWIVKDNDGFVIIRNEDIGDMGYTWK